MPSTREGDFMRKRFQYGSVIKRGKVWVGSWRQDGHRLKRVLGRRAEMTKSEALRELAKIIEPINSRVIPASQNCVLAHFIEKVYLTFYCRKWKRSTAL